MREAERREEQRRAWSQSPERKKKTVSKKEREEARKKEAAKAYEPGSIEAQMAAMGLPVEGFSSTHGKHVEGNKDFVVADVKPQRKNRQYMNNKLNRAEDKPRIIVRR